MTNRLFSNDSHFAFGAIMSKNRFTFLKGHKKEHSYGKQIDSQPLERS